MNTVILQFKKMTPLCLRLCALGCLAFSTMAQAAPSPNPPVGGVLNTADGQSAMPFVTAGIANSAFGAFAQFSITTGNNNTAVGAGALDLNNADNNTAIGTAALLLTTSGLGGNTAVGAAALENNSTGHHNTAVGTQALFANTTGAQNVAVGDGALGAATGGAATQNTVVGSVAGGSLTTGGGNVFVGSGAGNNFLSGDNNTCIGPDAGGGGNAGSSGSGNVFIGLIAGQNIAGGDSNICIGNAVLGETNAADSTYIGNINTTAQPIVGGVDGVTVDLTTGKLGHGVSSQRFKEQIKPMNEASEMLYALKPVTFRYKKPIDHTQTLDFGLIAEEVAAVNPELALRDRNGKITDYRRDAVNAMLLNEFLKQHQHVQEQDATIARQRKQIEALAAGLQKVSAQLEVSKPAPQTVLNNR